MGLEYVELLIVLEQKLQIQLRDDAFSLFWQERSDVQVREFCTWLETEIRRQIPSYSDDTFNLVKRSISEVTGIDESEIIATAWFIRDLDMG